MIITRDMNPRIMSYKSRDFQLMETWVDLMANSIKLDIDYFPNLINPEKCPAHWLSNLGSLVGYSYDDSLTVEQNRYLIANYKPLLRLRGSIQGVELAVAIYLRLIGREDSNFSVTVPTLSTGDLIEGVIYINDEAMDVSKIPLLSKLLEWVRPVGVSYVMRKSSTRRSQSNVTPENVFTLYQMQYPKDISLKNSSTGYNAINPEANDRSEAQPEGVLGGTDGINMDINEKPDNVVGHNIVDDGGEEEVTE